VDESNREIAAKTAYHFGYRGCASFYRKNLHPSPYIRGEARVDGKSNAIEDHCRTVGSWRWYIRVPNPSRSDIHYSVAV